MGRLWNQSGKAARRGLISALRRGWCCCGWKKRVVWREMEVGLWDCSRNGSQVERGGEGWGWEGGWRWWRRALLCHGGCHALLLLSLYIGILNSAGRIRLEIEMIVQTDKVEWTGASIAGWVNFKREDAISHEDNAGFLASVIPWRSSRGR